MPSRGSAMAAAVASARWHPHNASQLLTVSRLKQHQRKAQTMLSMRPARPPHPD